MDGWMGMLFPGREGSVVEKVRNRGGGDGGWRRLHCHCLLYFFFEFMNWLKSLGGKSGGKEA